VLEGLDAKLAEVTTSASTGGDMVEQVRPQTAAATASTCAASQWCHGMRRLLQSRRRRLLKLL
jgi:hypothetical protein